MAHPERLAEAYLDVAYAAALLPGARRAWLSMLECVMPPFRAPDLTYALRPDLARLQCPTRLVWGERDFCPPSWGVELARIIPAARLEVLPEAGHMVWLDEPERVARLLHPFLSVPTRAAAVTRG